MSSLAFCPAPLSGGPALSSTSLSSISLSRRPGPRLRVRTPSRCTPCTIVAADKSLALPAALDKLVDSFAAVPDAKLRYQQLLFFAKNLPPMDDALKTEANRVRGCTSVVFVNVLLDDDALVRIEADSDAQLTKGLIALLVNGLDGCTLDEVLAVDPAFINASGLSVSLTPSRNNGFVNMVAKIKEKLVTLREEGSSAAGAGMEEDVGSDVSEDEEDPDFHEGRPIYSAMLKEIRALKPVEVELKDNSARHAGHSGSAKGESHFALKVTSDAFDGLSLVKRHQLIFTLFSDIMPVTHSLTIKAHTPAEVEAKASKASK